jgi:hypothetical protein
MHENLILFFNSHPKIRKGPLNLWPIFGNKLAGIGLLNHGLHIRITELYLLL